MEKATVLQKTVRRIAGRTVAVATRRLREIKNHRRVQLIRKSGLVALGAGETAELARLQDDCIADANTISHCRGRNSNAPILFGAKAETCSTDGDFRWV